MIDDPRCCGSNACIIDEHGRCWCGQVWDGDKMCYPDLETTDKDNEDEQTGS